MSTEGKKSPRDIPESPEELKKEIDNLLGDITVKLLDNQEARRTMFSIAGTVMSAWSAGNPLKKIISYLALKAVPTFPPAETSDHSADIAAGLGRLMMLRWALQAHENRENPAAAGEKLITFIKAFLDNTDLSEWKTGLESSGAGRIDTARRLNEVLTDYQGKLLVLISALPAIVSIFANSLKSFTEAQLKMMPPDVLFEIYSGVNRQINWKEVGLLLNDHYELTRRFHISSSLGGDGVTPALQTLAQDVLGDIIGEIDPERFAQVRAGKAENREALKNAVSNIMRKFPEFGKKMITSTAFIQNARIRAARNRLQVLADLSGDDVDDIVNEFLKAFDAFEMADLVSLTLEIVNSIHGVNPERIPKFISAFAMSVDTNGLRELASREGLIRDILKAVKPLTDPLMPALINGLCDLLTPEAGESNEELRQAMRRLKGILGEGNANQ